jgi:hypothetical protein
MLVLKLFSEPLRVKPVALGGVLLVGVVLVPVLEVVGPPPPPPPPQEAIAIPERVQVIIDTGDECALENCRFGI